MAVLPGRADRVRASVVMCKSPMGGVRVRASWLYAVLLVSSTSVVSGSTPAAACSGPFFDGVPAVPAINSVGVPTNALLRVGVAWNDDRTSLEVELRPDGGDAVPLTLVLDEVTGYFVGAPAEPWLPDTHYVVMMRRRDFCAYVYPGEYTGGCAAGLPSDSWIEFTWFDVGTQADDASPQGGTGEATFSFGERMDIGYTTCAGDEPKSYYWVTSDDAGWVATDDVGIAGYHIVHEGTVVARFQARPFPSEVVGCTGSFSVQRRPGTYQVIAEDYAGHQSMLSTASTLSDPCVAESTSGCSVRPNALQSSWNLSLVALVASGAGLLAVRRRPRRASATR